MSGERRPYLSVIVPAHDAEHLLPDTLGALLESDHPRSEWELVVVDDASTDATAEVARRYADRVVEVEGTPKGPAFARNRGFEASRGECVAFVDADCRVHPDTLGKLAETMRDGRWGAAFGSYDADPPAPGLVSRFRNLMHHWVHQQNAGEAETFWAGCGVVRSRVFEEVGMYDEWHYGRPEIEDIELGRRIRLHGHRILLRPDAQVTHLKRWTLKGMVETDFRHRGVAWTRLLIQEGASAPTRALNLQTTQKVCTGAAPAAALAVLGAAVTRTPWLLGVAGALVLLVAAFNARFYWALGRSQGWWFPFAALPVHLLHYATGAAAGAVGWATYQLVGGPYPAPAAAAFREVGVETSTPQPRPPEKSLWKAGSMPGRAPAAATAATGSKAATPTAGKPAGDAGLAGRLELAFLPLHKRALGVATGTAAGLVVFLVTGVYLLRDPSPGIELELLAQYFYGYDVSLRGAVIGGGWGWFVGFVAGWFLAFCRNLVLAASSSSLRRASGSGKAEFMEHL